MIGWLTNWRRGRLQRRQVARWKRDVDRAKARWEKAQSAVTLAEWHEATWAAANTPRRHRGRHSRQWL